MNNPLLLFLGFLLFGVGLIQFAIARDKNLWRSYAVESFRYCSAFGFLMVGSRVLWIWEFGDEIGISFVGQLSWLLIGIGQLGLQVNNLTTGRDVHVPKWVKRAIE